MTGFTEIIAILLALGAFGVDANPKAPSAQEVMKFAPAEFDAMLYFDIQSVVPKNYQAFKDLPKIAAIKNNTEARTMLEKAIMQAEMFRNMAKGMTGFDPVDDVKSVAGWVISNGTTKSKPDFVVIIRGKFPKDTIDKMAAIGATKTTLNGVTVIEDDGMVMAMTADGSIIGGTKALVEPRLAKKWKPVRGKANSTHARALNFLKPKPFMALISAPTSGLAKEVAGEVSDIDNVLSDMIKGHEFAGIRIVHNGVGWEWTARDAKGFARAVAASEGVLNVMRAAHFGVRGITQIVLSGIDSYAGKEPVIAQVIKHKAELLKLVEQLSGDGRFRANVKKQAKKRTVTVSATGRKLSDVLPGAAVLPLAAAGFLGFGKLKGATAASFDKKATAYPISVEPSPTRRLRLREVYQQAKANRDF